MTTSGSAEDSKIIRETSVDINDIDINELFNFLSEKDDTVRYAAFQILQRQSAADRKVYPYWDRLCEKMKSENSYQRSIGVMLIADNIRWDSEHKFDAVIDDYLSHCTDEKFITSRQTIQSIENWIEFRHDLIPKVTKKLMGIEIMKLKDTQKKLILFDILNVLISINKAEPDNSIESYITSALTGGILDDKSIKKIKKML